jgi:hypothetical protein
MLATCPPEIIVDSPSPQNNWSWSWGVYQPDCHWVQLAGGKASSREQAFEEALAAKREIEFRRLRDGEA